MEDEWLYSISKNPVFDFLNEPEEDIYTSLVNYLKVPDTTQIVMYADEHPNFNIMVTDSESSPVF